MNFRGVKKGDVVSFTVSAVFNFSSEFLATGTLVFLGCMSSVSGLGQEESRVGICLAFAFAVVAGVEVGLHMSGGHVNPILTIAAVVFKKVSIPMFFVYALGQTCGAIAGYGLVVCLNPRSETNVLVTNGACVTVPHPDVTIVQALFSEFISSFILVWVFCGFLDPRNDDMNTFSMRFGFVVFACAYACGGYSGCSMNPARSLAPAIWNNSWTSHWSVGSVVVFERILLVLTSAFVAQLDLQGEWVTVGKPRPTLNPAISGLLPSHAVFWGRFSTAATTTDFVTAATADEGEGGTHSGVTKREQRRPLIYWVGPITAAIMSSLIYEKIFVELWPKKPEEE